MRFNRTMIFAALLTCAAGLQATAQSPAALKAGEVRLTYIGNAGWEITDGKTIVLVDPFLTQFARWAPGAAEDGPNPDGVYPADTALINKHVQRADYIVITHGHPDHALDAGYISRRTGATIIGHETAANLARAYGVTDSSLITVIGGEDYEFGNFSLKVIPNIHSALDKKHYYNNTRKIVGTAPRGLKAPLPRSAYVEGGNLAYLLRIAGHEILITGSMNYIEREMQGLRPDIALIGANTAEVVFDFAPGSGNYGEEATVTVRVPTYSSLTGFMDPVLLNTIESVVTIRLEQDATWAGGTFPCP